MLFPHRNWRPFTLPATLPVTRIFSHYPTRTLPEVKKPYPSQPDPDTHIYMGRFPEDWENGHFVSLRVNKFYGPPSGVSWVFMIQITQNNCEIKSSSSVLGERGLYFFLFLRTRNCHIPRPRETKPLCVYLDVWCHCQPSLVVMKPVLFAHSPFSESTWPDSEKRVCGGVQYLLMWQLVTDETWQWKGWVRWGVY